MRTLLFINVLLWSVLSGASAKDYALLSPDKQIRFTISVDENVTISIFNQDRVVLESSPIGMVVDGHDLCVRPKVVKTATKTFDGVVRPVMKTKTEEIKDNYNELTLTFKDASALILRAYNEGVAYRFKTNLKKEKVIVDKELLTLKMPASSKAYLMQEEGFYSMSESPYVCSEVSQYKENSLFSLPALFKTNSKDFMLLAESDLYDYPGLWLTKKKGDFQSRLPEKVTKTKEGACTNEQYVTERTNYLAETGGQRSYPWRIFAIADAEAKLVTNQLVYLLATPEAKADYSWIKPGGATLDWWGRRNVYDTDFKGGVNTETHKFFVDFNNKYGLKYFVLDDGWSDACDLKRTNKDLDLEELHRYANQQGVGLVFWVHAFALKQDIPGYLDFIKSKGAVGIKVDFFARDDQDAINLFHQIAKAALDRQLVIDFHGVCKPFGLSRTYPNVLTSEGLIEFEMNGVTDWANPDHHTLLPFIRMATGPMDYLPGTLNNAQKKEFHMNGNRPVGLGTRAHSLALAVVFESPLTMIPDSPSDYLKEDECTSFLCEIPTVWDETRVLDAKIGEYIVIARRSGSDWFLAAITNWEARTLSVNLDFLTNGNYNMQYFMDGINANTRAIDYKTVNERLNTPKILTLNLAKGGGWVGKITK